MKINHRHTRTGFANARPDLEMRKRERGASVCPPQPLVRRSLGAGGWRRRVLVCGSLQRFQRVGGEEKVDQANVSDTIVVSIGGRVLSVDHHLLEVVARMLEREGLLRHLLLVGNHPGGLDVDALVAAIHNKVDFMGAADRLALWLCEAVKASDIHIVSASDEFIENHVLHQMRMLALALCDMYVSDTCVGGVIFGGSVEVAFAFDVESPCLLDKKSVFKTFEIVADRNMVGLYVHGGLDCVREFGWIGKSADSAHDDICKCLEYGIVFDFVTVDDVLKIDRLVKVLEIFPLLFWRFHENTFGKTSVQEVVHEGRRAFQWRFNGRYVFAKGERCHVDDFAPSPELRGDVLGKHFCVGASHVCDDIRRVEKSVQDIVKGDIAVVAVVRMDSCKIDSGRENLLDILDFVDQNVNRLSVFRNGFTKMLAKKDWIAKVARFILFKVKGYDVGTIYPSLLQMIEEKIEKKITLPASANAGDELHEMMPFASNEFVKNVFSFNCHQEPTFCLREFSRKLKTYEVYHIYGAITTGFFSINIFLLDLEERKRERGASVSVCGSLKRFQRLRVEEKGHDAHEGDAVSVGPGLFIRIAGHDDLPEVVSDVAKRKGLLFALFVVGDVPCGLDVKAHIAIVDDEIDFIPLSAALAADGREHLHDTDIHRVVASDEFVVDGVLHEMRVFSLPKVESRIPNAGVNGIILGGIVEIAVAAQIEESGVSDKECGFKIAKILAHGRFVAYKIAEGVYRVAQLCRICKVSDVAHGRVGHHFKQGVVLEAVSLDDVPEVDGRVEVVKILPLFGFGTKEGTFGEPAESEVGIADLEEIPGLRHRFGEFCERKRGYHDGFAASPELGGYILREKVGVGAGDVCGDVLSFEKPVENMVEGDVGLGAIVGAQTREIGAFRQDWLCMLDFIDKHETGGIVSGKSSADLLAEGDCIAAEKKVVGFKVDFHDMVRGNATVKQMLLEEVEEKKAFSTTSHTNQNFDEMVAFYLDKLVQKDVSLDGHRNFPALKLCAHARKFKTVTFYHTRLSESTPALNFCAHTPKFKTSLPVLVCGLFVNYGRTRTGIANARPDLGWRKRKRCASVLVCGLKNNHVWVGGLEQVAVRAGSGQFKDEDVLVDLIDERPVRLDMTFAMICPVVREGMVSIGGGQSFASGKLADDVVKLRDVKSTAYGQLVVSFELASPVNGILLWSRLRSCLFGGFHRLSSASASASVYRRRVGSLTMRSPSSIAAMVSAFGRGSAEMVKGMRFSRITVLMYTVITEDAERPTFSQKSTKRFLVRASSENVMFAMVILPCFEVKTCVLYANHTGCVKVAA